MPDAPITHREFDEFQARLFGHLDRQFSRIDHQFEVLRADMTRGFDEVRGQIDGLAGRLDRLDVEYQMIVAGLRRVEERLEVIDGRLDAVEGRIARLEQRVDALDAGQRDTVAAIQRLEERLRRVEARVGEIAAAQGGRDLRRDVAALRVRVRRLEAAVRELTEQRQG